jgi:hypothetical protein
MMAMYMYSIMGEPNRGHFFMVFSCFCFRRRKSSPRDIKPSWEVKNDSRTDVSNECVMDDTSAADECKTPELETISRGANPATQECLTLMISPVTPDAKIPQPLGESVDQALSDTMVPHTPQEDLSDILQLSGDEHQKEIDGAELMYIDDIALRPTDQYNMNASVPFFSGCASSMGYTSARLLHLRMSGIVIAREATPRHHTPRI